MDVSNHINFNFLNSDKKTYKNTVMIILNRPILAEQFNNLYKITDYVICADGAANRLYHLENREKYIPNEIVGDFDSILPEVKSYYDNFKVIMRHKKEQDNSDLYKCLYIAFEKQGSIDDEMEISQEKSNKSCIIILGANGGRIDHTISTYHNVLKFVNSYPEQNETTDIFMISKCSISIFLKPGENTITYSSEIQNLKYGYSLIPLFGESEVKIFDESKATENQNEESVKLSKGKFIGFGEDIFYFRNSIPQNLKILVVDEKSAVIYTCTTNYYDKFN